MSEPVDGASVDIRSYLDVPRRRWRIVAIVAVLGILAVVGYVKLIPPSYKATAVVQIDPVGVNLSSNSRPADDLVNTQTEAQIVKTPGISEAVAERLGSPASAAKKMRERLTVTPSSDTATVEITYAAPKKKDAINGANTFAQVYLDHRNVVAREQQERQLNALRQAVAAAQRGLIAANKTIATAKPRTDQMRKATSDRELLTRRISSLTERQNDVLTIATEPGTIIRRGGTTPPKSSTQSPLFLAGGVLGAIVLGLVVAFVRDRMDKRVLAGRDIARVVHAPLLVNIPTASGVPLSDDAAAESYRKLRALLLPALKRRDTRVILVVDLTHGGGSGTPGANLAVSLARARNNVALLLPGWTDADAAGLGELGGGAATVEAALSPRGGLQASNVRGLSLAVGGADRDGLRDLLASEGFRAMVVDQAARDDGYVVLDASGDLSQSELLSLAGVAGAALVVGQVIQTTTTEAAAIATELERLGTPIAGCAVITGEDQVETPHRHEKS